MELHQSSRASSYVHAWCQSTSARTSCWFYQEMYPRSSRKTTRLSTKFSTKKRGMGSQVSGAVQGAVKYDTRCQDA